MSDQKGKKREPIPELDDRGFLKDFKDLERSYRETHKWLRSALVATGEDGSHPDEKIIRGAISDVNLAVSWMQTGRRPGNKRGIERRGVYANTKFVDPMILQSYANPINSRSASTLTEDERMLLSEALSGLSAQERECYVMAHGHGMTRERIAAVLKIERGSVNTYIERAKIKISREWNQRLFDIG